MKGLESMESPGASGIFICNLSLPEMDNPEGKAGQHRNHDRDPKQYFRKTHHASDAR
jgi:hypothetical protein